MKVKAQTIKSKDTFFQWVLRHPEKHGEPALSMGLIKLDFAANKISIEDYVAHITWVDNPNGSEEHQGVVRDPLSEKWIIVSQSGSNPQGIKHEAAEVRQGILELLYHYYPHMDIKHIPNIINIPEEQLKLHSASIKEKQAKGIDEPKTKTITPLRKPLGSLSIEFRERYKWKDNGKFQIELTDTETGQICGVITPHEMENNKGEGVGFSKAYTTDYPIPPSYSSLHSYIDDAKIQIELSLLGKINKLHEIEEYEKDMTSLEDIAGIFGQSDKWYKEASGELKESIKPFQEPSLKHNYFRWVVRYPEKIGDPAMSLGVVPIGVNHDLGEMTMSQYVAHVIMVSNDPPKWKVKWVYPNSKFEGNASLHPTYSTSSEAVLVAEGLLDGELPGAFVIPTPLNLLSEDLAKLPAEIKEKEDAVSTNDFAPKFASKFPTANPELKNTYEWFKGDFGLVPTSNSTSSDECIATWYLMDKVSTWVAGAIRIIQQIEKHIIYKVEINNSFPPDETAQAFTTQWYTDPQEAQNAVEISLINKLNNNKNKPSHQYHWKNPIQHNYMYQYVNEKGTAAGIITEDAVKNSYYTIVSKWDDKGLECEGRYENYFATIEEAKEAVELFVASGDKLMPEETDFGDLAGIFGKNNRWYKKASKYQYVWKDDIDAANKYQLSEFKRCIDEVSETYLNATISKLHDGKYYMTAYRTILARKPFSEYKAEFTTMEEAQQAAEHFIETGERILSNEENSIDSELENLFGSNNSWYKKAKAKAFHRS